MTPYPRNYSLADMCVPMQGNPKDSIANAVKNRNSPGAQNSVTPQETKGSTSVPSITTPESPTRPRRRSLIIDKGRGGSGLNIPS